MSELKPHEKLLQEHPEVFIDFQKILKPLTCKKGELLHIENSVCKHSYFIEKGAARLFSLKKGNDVTAHFAFEGQAITAIDSLLQGGKSKYNIELIEDSTLFAYSYEDLETLFQKSILHERYGRLFLQHIYIELVDRIEAIQFNTAQERYKAVILKHPEILQRVSLKHIASYIGVTPETLSRIRRL